MKLGFCFLFLCSISLISCDDVERPKDRQSRYRGDGSRTEEDSQPSQAEANRAGGNAEVSTDEIREQTKNFFKSWDVANFLNPTKKSKCKGGRKTRTTAGFLLSVIDVRLPYDKALDCLEQESEEISRKICDRHTSIQNEIIKEEDAEAKPEELESLRIQQDELFSVEENFRKGLNDLSNELEKAKDSIGGKGFFGKTGREITRSSLRTIRPIAETYCT